MSDDRLLKLVGIALVSFILLAVLTGILAAMNPDAGAAGPEDTVWSGEMVNETHFEITYEEGQPIHGERLVVAVDGYDRHGVWTGRVRPGDSGTVRVSSGSVVKLQWLAERGPRELLGRWEL